MSSRPQAGATAITAAILATALNLRIAIVGVGPLVVQIRHAVGISSGVAGLFTTIPYACMSLFAFGGARVVQRFGYRRLMQGSLATLALGSGLRALMPSAPLLLLLTVPLGVGIALVGVALPPVVRHAFAGRGGAVTGAYVAAMNTGATLSSVAAVPLATALGGWREALACGALPAALAMPLWRRSRVPDIPRPGSARGHPTRWRVVCVLSAVFAAQSVCFTGVIAWVAALYSQLGWSRAAAGLTPAFISLVSLPFALVVPRLSDGGGRQRSLALFTILYVSGTTGLALLPSSLPWLWLALFAIGGGPLFPLSLTLPIDAARDHREATTLTMWTLGIGFGISSLGPFMMGVLHDLTGDFTVGLLVLAAISTLTGILGQRVPRPPNM